MITLPKLPYSLSAFEPDISTETMTFHYTKHHQGYVQKTNDLIHNTPLENNSLKDIILTAASDTIYTTLFNNAAQVFNHNFYWNSILPQSIPISSLLLQAINNDFGSLSQFQSQLLNKGLSQFASGWIWLVLNTNNQLEITTTSNANNPLTSPELIPLFCLDLWEHAYYLDYQNKRIDYLNALIQNHINWQYIEQNYTKKLRTN